MTEMVYGALPRPSSEPILPRWWRSVDKISLMAVFALFGIGILLGFAASVPLAERNNLPPYTYVTRQFILGGFGMVVMVALSLANPAQVRRLGVLGFAIAALLVLSLPVIGTDLGKGAVRWINFGFTTVQPSEFLKPGLMVFAAWLIAAAQDLNGPPGKLISFLVATGCAFVLALQPDFGQAMLVMFGWGVIYFVAGAPMRLIIGIVGLVAAAGYAAYNLSGHVARRINGYLAADVDPRSQIGYAANAIQEGGFFGVGLGEGQVKWTLPDAHTDFIIAVAAEEYGLMLVLVIIALYATIVLRAFWRLAGEREPFVRYAGMGLTAILGVQAMINMGVAVRLLPAKGMTLPFISYGGSSVIAASITMGLLLALTRNRPQGQISDIFRRGR
ncbi:MAG: putative peptidoglycan glycosyltransferase FtsW [Cypionkella sp.]|nr:putative peptidoglycan glycosyltransferase FtsW [Cypionkella sp.]